MPGNRKRHYSYCPDGYSLKSTVPIRRDALKYKMDYLKIINIRLIAINSPLRYSDTFATSKFIIKENGKITINSIRYLVVGSRFFASQIEDALNATKTIEALAAKTGIDTRDTWGKSMI